MDVTWLATHLGAALLLPPLGLLLVAAAGWILGRRRPALGRGLVFLALAGLWLLSTPLAAERLLALLQPPHQAIRGDEAEAIVILGGGTRLDAPEYGGDSLGRYTLERLRYGAWLQRRTGKPVLVTGGNPRGGRPEARLMRDTLTREFGVPVAWVEDLARNTRENARLSAPLLKAAGVRRIYLVTHAWHLPRAVPEFERAGLAVLPAGMGYAGMEPLTPLDFLPSAEGLKNSQLAFHEAIGIIWYRLRN